MRDTWVARHRDESTELLRELLRIDTSNPPGGETPAALLLQDYFDSNGVPCELVAREPGRANLVARLSGIGGGPSLALVGHLDVVPARAQDWTHPPFSGHLDDDGFVWGRGAADMKNELATRAVVMASLTRSGFQPRGELTFVAAADEEDGTAGVGMSWLLRARPDLRADYVLNEGAAERLLLSDGRTAVTINVGEKAAASVRITARGEPRASTVPVPGESAVVRLARLIERLDSYQPRTRLLPETLAVLESLVGDLGADPSPTQVQRALTQVATLHPALVELIVPLFATTIVPTRLHGSDALNVIPATASVDCDARLVPRTSEADLRAEIIEALADTAWHQVDIIDDVVGGSISTTDSTLMSTVRDILADVDPGAVLVPTLLNGFTDSHYYREYFGSQAYGFWPVFRTPYDVVAEGVHGNDERIHGDDLGYATGFQERLCRDLLGGVQAATPTSKVHEDSWND